MCNPKQTALTIMAGYGLIPVSLALAKPHLLETKPTAHTLPLTQRQLAACWQNYPELRPYLYVTIDAAQLILFNPANLKLFIATDLLKYTPSTSAKAHTYKRRLSGDSINLWFTDYLLNNTQQNADALAKQLTRAVTGAPKPLQPLIYDLITWPQLNDASLIQLRRDLLLTSRQAGKVNFNHLTRATKAFLYRTRAYNGYPDQSAQLTIYRTNAPSSQTAAQALLWTTDYAAAAVQQPNSQLYQAAVKSQDLLAYFAHNPGSELLVRSQDLISPRLVPACAPVKAQF